MVTFRKNDPNSLITKPIPGTSVEVPFETSTEVRAVISKLRDVEYHLAVTAAFHVGDIGSIVVPQTMTIKTSKTTFLQAVKALMDGPIEIDGRMHAVSDLKGRTCFLVLRRIGNQIIMTT